ncbi:MAG: phosphatidylserine decarboxylase family protein [Deltaproteobacteria bacterium]|nr:phosphatidylserine decarboxylase family protein [Deltaproteobacteria bacterium]
MEKTRINNKWPVAREGIPFFLFGVLASSILFITGLLLPGFIMVFLSLFALYFFRDPERRALADEKTVLAPADGKILEIRKFEDNENPLGMPAVKLSIFMSLFNVHVNRVPVHGKITKIEYNPGKFFSANLDKASEYNEKNLITLLANCDHRIVLIQIAGLIARRIVCWVKETDYVKSGQRLGLIRFGSRLDIYIPENSQITVQKYQKVKAGETILGYLS